MFNKIIAKIKKFFGIEDNKKSIVYMSSSNDTINYIINDPTTSDLVLNINTPEKPKPEIAVSGFVGGGQDPSSIQGQAAQCYATISNCLKYISNKTLKPIKGWSSTKVLNVYPRAGADFNAYYNRKSLKFFYGEDKTNNNIVFTCESADIVSHELGHAILDSIRPEFFNLQAHEIWAFHESFGDCMAIINILLYEKAIDKVLEMTKNDLNKSNLVSRLAEEMGGAIYNLTNNKNGFSPDSLRDAVNDFKYIEPEKLPKNSPNPGELARECHNFSRIWTGTWYEFLVEVYKKKMEEGIAPKEALVKARDIFASYLFKAVAVVPTTVRFFDALGKQILAVDEEMGSPYKEILLKIFNKRNILRTNVMMLSTEKLSLETFDKQNFYSKKIYRKNINKKIKLKDKIEMQSDNPLMGVNIEVPNEMFVTLNKNDEMVSLSMPDEKETINCALVCLNDLHEEGLVGPEDYLPFAIENGSLVRKHFVYCCPANVACDPQAPEYGKEWKAKNNAGCCRKTDYKLNCSCEQPEQPTPKKVGCYTSAKVVRNINYRIGKINSYRTC